MVDHTVNPFETIAPGSALDRRRHWAVFRVFNYYRIILIGVLLGALYVDESTRFLGIKDPVLFRSIAVIYGGLVVIALLGGLIRQPALKIQVFIQTVVDIIALSLLAYTSGGLSSNLLPLLVVAIGASSIMLPLPFALFSAFLACCALLVIWLAQIYPDISAGLGGPFALFADGSAALGFLNHLLSEHTAALAKILVLSATLFAATLIIYRVAERTRHSEELAHQRSLELLDMAQLNQAIVKHMQSGILVVDPHGRIKLINQTARDLLELHDALRDTVLSSVSQVLAQRLAAWLSTGLNNAKPFRPAAHLADVSPLFTLLGDKNANSDILVFLEDSSQVEQRVQRIKLAALGRLTASIAHEIRNPLAAIDHAAQLLRESSTGSSSDKRLSNIIHENATRASQIITNVLDLSRRERAKPENIVLKPWLEEFGQEFLRNYNGPTPHMELRVSPKELTVRFDVMHLHQVLWNLVSNACKHGVKEGEESAHIKLIAQFDVATQRAYLDIIDSGPGINTEAQRRIFEPFFTTKTKGTGLGLYIAREICEANRGQLQYTTESASSGGCFRITFAQTGVRPYSVDVTRARASAGM